VEIARSFGERVKVIVNAKNRGPGHSRNAGVAASTGDYLAFLDADDKWLPEHLRTLARILDENPQVALAATRAELTGLRSGVWPDPLPVPADQPADCFALFMRHTFSHPSAWLIRRRVFEEIAGFQDIVETYRGKRVQAEDYDLLLRISYRYPVYASSALTYRYHWHPEQSSSMGAPQTVMVFKYRLRMLGSVGIGDARYELARDRMVRHWECILEETWRCRQMCALRTYVQYGWNQPCLALATRHYICRAFVPTWVVRLRDWLGLNWRKR
jgi:glycosyltransferase involved in cell wall biosynthesis